MRQDEAINRIINKNKKMKSIILGIAIAASTLAACNNSNNSSPESKTAAKDTDKTNLANTVSIKEIVSGYLQVKNAFTNDNTNGAATAGTFLETTIKNFDKSALTAAQKKIFEDVEDDAREHAEHIGANGGNIAHQREHFEMLSKDIYDLVKSFGNNGQTLYKDFCPMYNDNKGAFWISETKEIKNPYLGNAMPTCGTIKEELK